MRAAESTSTWNAGVVPIDSAFDRNRLDVGAVAAVDDEHRDRLARRRARSGTRCRRAAGRCRRAPMPRTFGSASVNCANETDADACGATVAVSRLESRGRRSSSVTGTSVERLVALVADAGGDGDALLAGERRAREGDRRHRRGSTVFGDGDRDGAERHALGEVHVLGPGPAGFWKSLISTASRALERRAAEDALGELQRRAVARRARRRPSRRRSPPRAARGPRSRACSPRRSCRTARAWRGRRRRGRGRRSRARVLRACVPVVAVAHARRLIEQDDEFARAAAGRRGDRALRGRTAARTPRRSARSPPRASAAGASGGCAAGAPTDRESAARTSATGTR